MASAKPRYAPADPSLPKPWRALIDGNTGYIYYWNPVTKLTQYEKPQLEADAEADDRNEGNVGRSCVEDSGRVGVTKGNAESLGEDVKVVREGEEGMNVRDGDEKKDNEGDEGMCKKDESFKGMDFDNPRNDSKDEEDDGSLERNLDALHNASKVEDDEGIFQNGESCGGNLDALRNESKEEEEEDEGTHKGDEFADDDRKTNKEGDDWTHKNDEDEIKPSNEEDEGIHKDEEEDGRKQDMEEKDENEKVNDRCEMQSSHKECTSKGNDNEEEKSVKSLVDATKVVGSTDSRDSGAAVQDANKRASTDDGKSGSSKRPRIAPPDPTLPKPWRALIDGNTGYFYYWNPVTKVTQYERPVAVESWGSPAVDTTRSYRVPDTSTANHTGENRRTLDSSAKNGQQQSPPGQNASNINFPPQVASSVESYRRQHEISVTGVNVPAPFMTFNSTGFPNEILRELSSAGFSAPTPIQAQSWPIALKGCDIVAVAKTGSGKTIGYLLPGFVLLKRLQNNPKMGPTMLVLSPTRELATQIQDEAIKFGQSSRISCTCLYGGVPKGTQLRELAGGVHVVVATPGRLNDILEMKRLDLSQVSYLVLDEADRMLDMGFEPQIRKIVAQVPARRQTLMFTATWPKAVRRIAADLLNNPVQVNIGNTDELVANKSITQHVEVIQSFEKGRRLEQILKSQEPGSKIIIFCSTKKMCDNLAYRLSNTFGAAAIHGDKSQTERDMVLNDFRSGTTPVLVATDVAARGLDVRDIRVVVNYDFPTGVEDYVHRIGRTGRAGAKGEAYTFFGDQDAKHASDLVKILEGASQQVPPELKQMTSYGGGYNSGGYNSGRSSRW